MILHIFLIRSAVAVVAVGKECFYGRGLLPLHLVEFLELEYPRALQLLQLALVESYGRQVAVVPGAAHELEEGRLVGALRSRQDEALVELYAWLEYPRHGGYEPLACDEPCERVVLRAEAVDDDGVEPFRAVPPHTGEVVPYRVIGERLGHVAFRILYHVLALEPVVLVEPGAQSSVVAVLPHLGVGPPRKAAEHGHLSRQLVEPDMARKPFVVAHDELKVGDAGYRVALLVRPQVGHPRGLVLLRFVTGGEVCQVVSRLLYPSAVLLGHHVLDGGAEIHHGRIGGQRGHVLRFLVSVLVAKLVEPHDVEGVAQAPVGGVGGVVAVAEVTAVVDDEAARRGSLGVGVAVVLVGRQIHTRQEGFHGLRHGVAAAEGADEAPLLLGRLRLLQLSRHQLERLPVLRGAYRPLRRVPPVVVGGKHLVRIEQVPSALLPEDVLSVLRRGRPEEEAAVLVGGRVELCDTHHLGHTACYRLVLLGRHDT